MRLRKGMSRNRFGETYELRDLGLLPRLRKRTAIRRLLLAATGALAAFVALVVWLHPAVPEASLSIAAEDMVDARHVPALMLIDREGMLPPTEEFIRQHSAEPEDPRLRESFAGWLDLLLAKKWLPEGTADKAVYLKIGTGRESLARSYFYAAYEVNGAAVMVQGFFASRVRVWIKSPDFKPPDALSAQFARAADLSAGQRPGSIMCINSFKNPSQDLRDYLRYLAEEIVSPALLPEVEQVTAELPKGRAWGWVLDKTICWGNSGFSINWSTPRVPVDPAFFPEERDWRGVQLFTNGRVVSVQVFKDPTRRLWQTDFYKSHAPDPVPLTVTPLNVQAIKIEEIPEWKASDLLPVSTLDRAELTKVKVTLLPPYTTLEGAVTHRHVLLPMTEKKWQLVEFAALLAGALGAAAVNGYQSSIVTDPWQSKDLAEAVAKMEQMAGKCSEIMQSFSRLRYPLEGQAVRAQAISALSARQNVWNKALPFWKQVLAEHPDESRSYLQIVAYKLMDELRSMGYDQEGLQEIDRRVGNSMQALLKEYEVTP